MTRLVFHICPRADHTHGEPYTAASLASEGFIHASQREQLLPTAARFFNAHPGPLIILAIDPQHLDVRWEAAVDGAGVFPHIYQPVPPHAVLHVWPFERGDDGVYRLPTAIA